MTIVKQNESNLKEILKWWRGQKTIKIIKARWLFPNCTSLPWGKPRKIQGMYSGGDKKMSLRIYKCMQTYSCWILNLTGFYLSSLPHLLCVFYSRTKTVRSPLPPDPHISHCWSINTHQNSPEDIAWDEMPTKSPFTSSDNAWMFLMGHGLLQWWRTGVHQQMEH